MKSMKRMSTFLLMVMVGFTLAQSAEDHELHHGPAARAGQAQMGPGMMSQISSERDFMRHMIAHHQEAVESAQSILEVSERQEVRSLAEDIISVQREEIATLEGWLEAWYPGEEAVSDYQPMMRDFSDLDPAEADRIFIEDMIAHHRMAVMDAQQLLMHDLAEHEEVAAMARDIVEVQSREIAELQSWLSDWYGSTTSTPMPGMMGQGMEGMHAMM